MPTVAPDSPLPSQRTLGIALALWLGLQLLALGVCAARWPLWARAPENEEQIALAVMLSVQVSAAALLFVVLLSDWRSATLAGLSGWGLAVLAGWLSDSATAQILWGEAYVTGWLMVLHIASRGLRAAATHLSGAAVAILLTLGPALLCYLAAEYGASPPERIGWFGPLMGSISQLGSSQRAAGWLQLGLFFLLAVAIKAFPRALHSLTSRSRR